MFKVDWLLRCSGSPSAQITSIQSINLVKKGKNNHLMENHMILLNFCPEVLFIPFAQKLQAKRSLCHHYQPGVIWEWKLWQVLAAEESKEREKANMRELLQQSPSPEKHEVMTLLIQQLLKTPTSEHWNTGRSLQHMSFGGTFQIQNIIMDHFFTKIT
jgi:hypothetical protein